MASIFTRIINGDIPSRNIWDDEHCVAFLDVRPLTPGHSLVVPKVEIDQWTDLDAELASHLMTVAHRVGEAQKEVFSPARIGLLIAGFEVPHAHVHVFPCNSMADFDFGQADTKPDQGQLDQQHQQLRSALAADG
jgi:histidine triad (HIT) family protein